MSAKPISSATEKSLHGLSDLMVQPPADLAAADMSHGFKSAGIPSRFVSESGDNESLIICGNGFRAFRKAQRLLSAEPLAEHLQPRELETQLWDLSCELFFEREKYSEATARKARVRQFQTEVTKPWDSFECAFSVAHLRIDCPSMQIGSVQYTQWDEVPSDWKMAGHDEVGEDMKDQCVAITTAAGGDVTQAVARAREVVDGTLDALRLGVAQTIYVRISGPELAFQRSEFELIRRAGADRAARFNRSFAQRAVTTSIVADRAKAIQEYLRPIVGSRGAFVPEFGDRIRLAARWIGASAMKPDVDDKVVALCTAVEALLASKSDRLKGETVAIRAMLLPLAIGEGFTDPFPLYALYNRRSDVIHGTRLGICGDEDYRLLHFEATLILKHMMALLSKHPELKKFEDLVQLIETSDGLKHAAGWFARFGKPGKPVVKAAEQRLEQLGKAQ